MKRSETLVAPDALYRKQVWPARLLNLFPLVPFLMVVCSVILVGIMLPLRGLLFYQVFPETRLGSWLMLPTRLLFPQWAIVPPAHNSTSIALETFTVAWQEVALLFVGLLALCVFYVFAVRLLPKYITLRYIFLSTLLLGLVYVLIPVATSQDIFSYISYARMGVIYHLNPLTARPSAMVHDPTYPYIFWINQPSAYGPTWAILTGLLQWVVLISGFKNILTMVLLLRLLGLAAHLASIWLIWSISGHWQYRNEAIARRTRLAATLAFAWNPLLLFEACTNAHNDTIVLCLILCALWFLLPERRGAWRTYLPAALLLALAACLKITFILFFPGLLLYLWAQSAHRWRRVQHVFLATLAYVGAIVLLYAPFWQHGVVLHVLQVNPGTSRDINSLYEFLLRLSSSIRGQAVPFVSSDVGSRPEVITHLVSMGLFVALYALLCLGAVSPRWRIRSLPSLIRWMALAWLLYCLIGSPWFWPWYMVTFFGLVVLLMATSTETPPMLTCVQLPLSLQFLTFSMLCLYCFFTWGPHSFIPQFPYFQWAYIRGLWAWIFLVPALRKEALTELYRSTKTLLLSTYDWFVTLISNRPSHSVVRTTTKSTGSRIR